MVFKSNNTDHCLIGINKSVQEETGKQAVGAEKLAQCRTHLSRRLMRGNPENHCPVSLVSIFSKIIG